MRVREYPSIETVGVGHGWDLSKEKTEWNVITNKSERVIKCWKCGVKCIVKSKAFGKGRKKK